MKKLIFLILIIFNVSSFVSCSDNEDGNEELTEWECGSHNGNTLYTGPRGGCYYYNSNGNKIYVDRSECNC
ncbi:MAG: hypothetical protein EVB11_05320 [Winogradskyella sp.]|nr:MAG: hypothetical protein EVB11_05320 [Winogradskyella sp.]